MYVTQCIWDVCDIMESLSVRPQFLFVAIYKSTSIQENKYILCVRKRIPFQM